MKWEGIDLMRYKEVDGHETSAEGRGKSGSHAILHSPLLELCIFIFYFIFFYFISRVSSASLKVLSSSCRLFLQSTPIYPCTYVHIHKCTQLYTKMWGRFTQNNHSWPVCDPYTIVFVIYIYLPISYRD